VRVRRRGPWAEPGWQCPLCLKQRKSPILQMSARYLQYFSITVNDAHNTPPPFGMLGSSWGHGPLPPKSASDIRGDLGEVPSGVQGRSLGGGLDPEPEALLLNERAILNAPVMKIVINEYIIKKI